MRCDQDKKFKIENFKKRQYDTFKRISCKFEIIVMRDFNDLLHLLIKKLNHNQEIILTILHLILQKFMITLKIKQNIET